jgi:hypothetical protein
MEEGMKLPTFTTLIQNVRQTNNAIDLIGYREDCCNFTTSEKSLVLEEISKRLLELSKFKARLFIQPKRIRHMGQLYSRANVQQSEQTNPDYDAVLTGGKLDEPKQKESK